MPRFICPFNGSVCKPSCQYWVQERSNQGSFFNGFIPIGISMDDIMEYISPKLKGKKYFGIIPIIWSQVMNMNMNMNGNGNYDDSGPVGRCTKMEKTVDISNTRRYEIDNDTKRR